MRDFVYGDDVIIWAFKDDDYRPFACAEEVAINMSSGILNTTTADSGAWEYNIPDGRNSWKASMTGVTVLQDPTDILFFPWETLLYQLRTIGLDLKFTFTDRAGFEKHATGHAFIPESEINGKSGDFSRFSLELTGSGPLDVNGIVEPKINPEVERIEWITTGTEPNKVQSNKLIGITKDQLQMVSREGDDKFFAIITGVPTGKQVLLNNITGELSFLNDFDAFEQIWCQILN